MEKKIRKCEKCMPSKKGAIFKLDTKAHQGIVVLVWRCENCGYEIPFRYRRKK